MGKPHAKAESGAIESDSHLRAKPANNRKASTVAFRLANPALGKSSKSDPPAAQP